MKKQMILTAVALVTLCGVGFLHADWGGPRRGHGPLAKMWVQLDPTDAQRQQAGEILARYRDVHRAEMDQLAVAREALFAETHAEVFNEAAVREAHRRVAVNEENLAVVRGRALAELTQVLTPEQKETLAQFRSEARVRMEERRADMRDLTDAWIDRQIQ